MPQIEFSSAGINLGDPELVPWSEILGVHVTEVDTMTSSVTILQLEHESGHYLEIHELHYLYPLVLKNLALYLPLYKHWTNTIRGLEPGTSLTIWKR